MSAQPASDSRQRFEGDRYQRLRQGAEVLAGDPVVAGGPFPFNGRGVVEFVGSLKERGALDDLSESDADLVAMHLLLDFPGGPSRMAWRLQYWLSPVGRGSRPDADVVTIAAVFAAALRVVIDDLIETGGRRV